MVILCFGDIFGKPGRQAVKTALPDLIKRFQPDFIIGNAENLAGGKGVNRKTFEEMRAMGFDAMTSGNHIWDNKEVLGIFEETDRLIRPVNLPDAMGEACPGKGSVLLEKGGHKLFLVNVMGRVFMDSIDCPFQAMEKVLAKAPHNVPVFVDVHADATSEKAAMGWFLNGRVAAVVGTHTHVQTADEQILPGGTAFITDLGMSGAFQSCIGMEPRGVVRKFQTKRRVPFVPAVDRPGIGCVAIKLSPGNRALSIERVRFEVENKELFQGGDLE